MGFGRRDKYILAWWAALSIVWLFWMYGRGAASCEQSRPAFEQAEASYLQEKAVYEQAIYEFKDKGFWHGFFYPSDNPETNERYAFKSMANPAWSLENPTLMGFWYVVGALLGLAAIAAPAAYFGRLQDEAQASLMARVAAFVRGRGVVRDNLGEAEKDVTAELGKIDANIRVLETERDPNKRQVAIINMQTAVTRIRGLSGPDRRQQSLFRRASVVAHARLTSEHLCRIGMSNDRINHDLAQIFGIALRIVR